MSFSALLQRFGRSPAFKFIVICFLILALMIPLLFVWSLASERKGYASRATNEVSKMWSGEQLVRGPYILVPIKMERVTRSGNTKTISKVTKYAIFLPETLNASVNVDTEELSRGIFKVPVYRSTVSFRGHFDAPELKRIERDADEIIWSDAVLATNVSDVRGIKKTAEITVGGDRQKFRPGIGAGVRNVSGIHIPISETQAKEGFRFEFSLDLNGSRSIGFVPAGGESSFSAKSNWPHPSFVGSFLPETRNVTENGFDAKWVIPRLARGEAQSFIIDTPANLLRGKAFRARLYQSAGYYSLIDRSLKYAVGFIAIAFLAAFVMEILSRQRVHWIQYVFIGLALIVFYLVLLGLSEHIGFEYSYLLASISTCALVGLYGGSAFKSSRLGITLSFVLAVIYGLLYLLLRVEDYAMLIGSLAAFSLLALVMFVTRNVDWGQAAAEDSKASG